MEAIINWLFFNVILALLPLLLTFSIVKVKVIDVNPHWYEVIEDGQLFIFASVLSATAIGALALKESGLSGLGSVVNFCALLIILILSTALFAVITLQRLRQENHADVKRVSKSSVYCAIIASVLSYLSSL